MSNTSPQRLTMPDVWQAVQETLNLDRGLLRTLRDLLLRPQIVIQTYLFHDRDKYTRPTMLLMLTLATAIIASRHWLPTSNTYSPNLFLTITATNPDELTRLTLLKEYDDLLRMLLVPATSVLSYCLFRKQNWYFAEHLAFNTYVLAFQFFLLTLLVPWTGMIPEWIVGGTILGYFFLAYFCCLTDSGLPKLLKSIVVVVGSNLIFLACLYPLAHWVL